MFESCRGELSALGYQLPSSLSPIDGQLTTAFRSLRRVSAETSAPPSAFAARAEVTYRPGRMRTLGCDFNRSTQHIPQIDRPAAMPSEPAAHSSSRRPTGPGQKQSVWQELLDSLPDNINYVNGPVLSYCQIVSDLKLTVIVAKSAEYSLRLAS